MKGLQKVNIDLYVSEDGYKLIKKRRYWRNGSIKVKILYNPNGQYMGEPSTIADANKWIRFDRKEKGIGK